MYCVMTIEFYTHPRNLVRGETFVCTAARKIRKSLRTTDGFFKLATFAGSG